MTCGGGTSAAGVRARRRDRRRPLRHHRRLRQPVAGRHRPRQERRQDDRRQRAHGQLPAPVRPHVARPRRRAHRPPHRPRQAAHRAAGRHAGGDHAGLARPLALRHGGARGAAVPHAAGPRRHRRAPPATAPVEVSGPTTLAELRVTVERLQALGAEQVLVDGAINRLGSASPRVSDGVVVATGGMVGDTLDDVLETTVGDARHADCCRGVGPRRGRWSREHVARRRARRLLRRAGGVAHAARARRRSSARASPSPARSSGWARDTLFVGGALTQEFVDDFTRVLPPRRELRVVVRDATVLVLPPAIGRPLPAPRHPPRGAHAAARAGRDRQPVPRAAAVPAQGLLLRGRRRSRRPRPVFDVVNGFASLPGGSGDRATSVSS